MREEEELSWDLSVQFRRKTPRNGNSLSARHRLRSPLRRRRKKNSARSPKSGRRLKAQCQAGGGYCFGLVGLQSSLALLRVY